jgi:hypothetical protein
MRIKLNTWEDYQVDLGNEETRRYILVTAFRPTDTILESPSYAKVLWWDLLRLSAAGRRKGWIVMGKDDPITPKQIGHILHLDVKTEVVPGLQHHITEKRITIYSVLSENIPKYQAESTQLFTNKKDSEALSVEKGRVGKSREENTPAIIDRIFDFYLKTMEKNPKRWKRSDKRKKKVRARLKSFSEDEIKKAIVGCSESDFHMGRHPKTKGKPPNELEDNITRSDEQTERWLRAAEAKDGGDTGHADTWNP